MSWDYSHEQLDSAQTVSCDGDPVHRSRKGGYSACDEASACVCAAPGRFH